MDNAYSDGIRFGIINFEEKQRNSKGPVVIADIFGMEVELPYTEGN